jgi:hypothetical protein
MFAFVCSLGRRKKLTIGRPEWRGKRNMEGDKSTKRINERNKGLEIRKYLFILGLELLMH